MLKRILNARDMSLNDYPALEKVIDTLSVDDIKYINGVLDDFKERSYSSSDIIHGVYHVEKVFFFTYLLSKNIEEPYRRILLDAALYHDIGRENNAEDSFHGEASARKVNNYIMDNPIYENEENLALLRALIYGHCRDDNNDINSLENILYDCDLYTDELESNTEYIKYRNLYLELMRLLKDADALDRKRFGDVGLAALNPKYLRHQSSPELINIAEDINALYFELMKENYVVIDEESIKPGECLHSVGFDFFKINSVLEHGILSQDEMKKRSIHVPRNFTGGNFDRWISVVNIALVRENSTALKEFVEHGVTFKCLDVKMHEPLPNDKRAKALVQGLPWNKSNHNDERYVLGRIPPSKIIEIQIPANYVNSNLASLRYIYNSLDINLIRSRVTYYMKQTFTSPYSPLYTEAQEYLDEYKQKLDRYLVLNPENKREMDLVTYLDDTLNKLNNVIARMIINYYSKFFSQEEFASLTVVDVVEHELSKNKNISYNKIDNNGQVILKISFTNVKEDEGKVKF